MRVFRTRWKAWRIKAYLLALMIVSFLMYATCQAQTNEKAQVTLSKTNRCFFIENKGQWADEVLYLARVGGMDAWITKTGVVYDFYKNVKQTPDENAPTALSNPKLRQQAELQNLRREGQVVSMNFQNAETVTPQPIEKQTTYYNYFLGNDPKKWASNVPLYGSATMKNVYKGVDVRYYFDEGALRYDLVVAPNADLNQIKMKFDGADAVSVNENGELTLKTSLGEVTQRKLYAYQADGSTKKQVECAFKVSKNGVGFEMGEYDKTKPLIVDPIVYSMYLGGSDNDWSRDISTDKYGRAYITGFTNSANFPATSGAYDNTYNGGGGDIFVSRIGATTPYTVEFSTFIGGGGISAGYDEGDGITVDDSGIYVTGFTESYGFPFTQNAFDKSITGTGYDAFILKLNLAGSALIYCSLLGGSGIDEGYKIAVDVYGCAFVTGYTESVDFPGATSYNGNGDAFVSKISSDGGTLLFSRYIGGTGEDVAYSIALDNMGDAYITGFTTSATLPMANNQYNGAGDAGDAFVTKLNSGGNIIYSLYVGGSSRDRGFGITVDNVGCAYVVGGTWSSDFPLVYPYQSTKRGPNDVFITKIDNNGSPNFIFSTYFGGSSYDVGQDIKLDKDGNIVIIGLTQSSDFPCPSNSGCDYPHQSASDIFVSKFSWNNSQLQFLYSTYYGGSASESAWDGVTEFYPRECAIATFNSDVLLAGASASPNLLLASNSKIDNMDACFARIRTNNLRKIRLKVILEGAYLNISNVPFFPAMRPGAYVPYVDLYSMYHGSTSFPYPSVQLNGYSLQPVCWIGVEFRTALDAPATISLGAYLLEDGEVVAPEGEVLSFSPSVLPDKKYYIVVKEFSHLAIATPVKVDLTVADPFWDFTTSQTTAYKKPPPDGQDPLIQLHSNPNVYGMVAGDIWDEGLSGTNGIIDDADAASIEEGINNGQGGFTPRDVNKDGVVRAVDLYFVNNNLNRVSQVNIP